MFHWYGSVQCVEQLAHLGLVERAVETPHDLALRVDREQPGLTARTAPDRARGTPGSAISAISAIMAVIKAIIMAIIKAIPRVVTGVV